MKRIGWIIVSPTDIESNEILTYNNALKTAKQFLKDMMYTKIEIEKSDLGYRVIGDEDEIVEIWEILK